MVRNALIAGATGLTGHELVKELIKQEYYNSVHIIGRRPYDLEHEKLTSYEVDFDNFENFQSRALLHDVYVCLGTTRKKAGSKANFRKVDFDYVLHIAKWAKKQGAEKLAVISSIGASASSSNFYLKTKGEMEEALAEIGFSKLIILRPSLLVGARKEFRLAEKISVLMMSPLSKLMVGSMRKYRPVKVQSVARAMFNYLVKAKAGVTVVENEGITE